MSISNQIVQSDPTDPVPELVLITPEVALKLLETNDGNRPINKRILNDYVQKMENGEWKDNGESISISASGRLLNGQHRLTAIVKSGVSKKMVVVRNVVDEKAFLTFDSGKNRTAKDVFAISGEENAGLVAQASRVVYEIMNDKSFKRSATTNYDLHEFFKNGNEGIRDSVAAVKSKKGIARDCGQMAVACAMHFLFSKRDPLLCEQFFSSLSDGYHPQGMNAAIRLRMRLMQIKSKSEKADKNTIRSIFIRAWNAMRAGKNPSKLIAPKGRLPEIN